MKRNRITSALALLFVGLIVTASVAAMTGRGAPFSSRVRAFIASLNRASTANEALSTQRLQASSERITVRQGIGEPSSINLGGDVRVPTEYAAGTGVAELAAGSTRAHALASADFDEDGVPDVVGGYTGASGVGVVTLQRGNVDAVYPNSPEARERLGRGQFNSAPFHPQASASSVPEAAHFVGAGDFDADGHWDVVAARRGGRAPYFLRGDGHGNLASAERIELAGAVTALTTGEMNRRDGLVDVIVGVAGEQGAAVLVYESPGGALRGQPEMLHVPEAASGLALGAVDANESGNDLAIVAGSELIVIHGRDRRLSVDETGRAGVAEARISRNTFGFRLAGVAVGDIVGDEREDVAVLSGDGEVQVLARAGSAETERAGAKRKVAHNAQPESAVENAAGGIEWESSKRPVVRLTETMAGDGATNLLLTANASGSMKDDVLVLSGGRVHVIANEGRRAAGDKATGSGAAASVETADVLQVAASVGGESELAAALPMRLNSDALSDLIVVGQNSKAPSLVTTQAAATFTVNSAASTNDVSQGNGECKDSDGNCTLPAAVQEVNATAGAGPFTINFNIPGAGVPVIFTNAFGLPVIDKPLTIDGTTQPAGRVELRDTIN